MRYARTDAPHTWRDYDAVAAAAAERDDIDGLGIVFTGTVDDDGTQAVGIDIDACIDAYDACTADAAAIVNRAATLTERSQSGRGLHLLLRVVGGMHIVDAADRTVGRMRAAGAGRPTFGAKTPAVEMMVYSSYFAVTATPWGEVRPVRTVTVDVLRDDILRDYPALAARIRPGPSPDAPTARSGLPRAVRRILRDTTGRYPSRSEREYAVLAAMVNARWADDRIIGAVTSTSGMFGDALRTPDRIRRGEITPAQGAAYVRTALRKLRAAGDRPDVVTLRTDAARLADAVDAIAPGELTTKRAHETDRAVLRAVLARMIAAAAPFVAVAIRDIEMHVGAGIGRQTCANGLKRLTAAGWLTRTSTGTVTQAATYGLGDRARDTLARSGAVTGADTKWTLPPTALCVSVHFVSDGVRNDGRPLTDDDAAAPFVAALAAHRAIRPAAVAWRTMVGAMLTPADLADVLGVHLRTARRHIERLRVYGLVVTDGTAYTSTMRADAVERAAERLGIAAKRDAAAARIAAERDGIRRTINRRDRIDRDRAIRMTRARLAARHAPAHAPQAVQAAPDAHTAPQAVDDAQRAVQAAPDAPDAHTAPVSMTTDGVTLAAPVHGLAAVASTTAPDDITHTVTALRTAPPAAVSGADVDVDAGAGALFGHAAAR
jgi:hypothetical protein